MGEAFTKLSGLTPEQLNLLVSKLREKSGGDPAETIARQPREAGRFPLSPAQERLWFLDQLEPGSAAYNIAAALDLAGNLDAEALQRSLQQLVNRHEALRTVFDTIDGQAVQVLSQALSAEMVRKDLRPLPPGKRHEESERLVRQEARKPFDLSRGPLLRTLLLRSGQSGHTLVLVMHHIVADGWSVGVMIRELGHLYRAFLQRIPSRLPQLDVQYADYAVWQRKQLAAEAFDPHIEYWKRQLEGSQPALALPFDHPRPAARTSLGAARRLELPGELSRRLSRIAERCHATLFITLLAAFNALLHRYTSQTDISVASPMANRNRSEIEGLIGFFANTLILRSDLRGDPAFAELVARTREMASAATAHQSLPFEQLVRELDPQRSLSHAPLAQVMFAFDNALPAFDLPGLEITLRDLDTGTSKLDLLLSLRRTADGLAGFIEYSTDLFEASTIERLAGHLRNLLEGIAEDPQRRLSDLPLLSESERRTLLIEWNASAADFPRQLTLDGLFEEQARRTPQALAVSAGRQLLSYAELERRADLLALHLKQLDVGPEVCVGVLLQRCADMVAALLGILKAGGAYVPLDPNYPSERVDFMLQDSGAAAVVTQESLRASLQGRRARQAVLEQISRQPAHPSPPGPTRPSDADNLAYVIYTSGSTGRPKGVEIAHRSAVDLLSWAEKAFSAEEMQGVLASTSICFDLSVFELFAPLVRGGQVVLAEDALALEALADASQVTLINTVPSVMAELVRLGAVPPSVRTVNLAGEVLRNELAQQVYQAASVERVLNLYGPSEDTTYSTWALAERGAGCLVTIGRPVANTQAYLLDRSGNPTPLGTAGELCLAGDSLARGYRNRPAATAASFLPNPFSPRPGARLYRSGDLARYMPDGNLDYLGRLDNQVKLRGFRIELGEIEAALLQHPMVREAAAAVLEDGTAERRLAAYLVAEEGRRPESADLRRFLGQKLPEYMIPSVFTLLSAMPLTPSRKIDRRALPKDSVGGRPKAAPAAPGTPLEELIAGIWAQFLKLEEVGIDEDFFQLGGHSLLAARITSRIRSIFGVELPLRRFFEAPTVAALAQDVQASLDKGLQQQAPAIRPASRSGALPLSFEQQRLWFLDRLGPPSALYNLPVAMRLDGLVNRAALDQSLTEVLRRHEALRTTFHEAQGQPAQKIGPPAPTRIALVDLSGLDECRRQAAGRCALAQQARQPFDLSRGPLCRMALLRFTDKQHLIEATLHHIVTDGWSMKVLIGEFAAHYSAFSQGRPSPLAELPVQYADYACWQRGWLQGKALQERLEHWQRRLADAPSSLELPADRPRPAVRSPRGGHLPFLFPAPLGQGIEELSRQQGVTAFMTLLSAFMTLLARWSGQDDLLVGVPYANREQGATEGLIGFFANAMALRASVPDDPPFSAFLSRVRDEVLGAYSYPDLPLAKLVQALQPQRQLDRTPLFQAMFALQEPLEAPQLPGLKAELQDVTTGTSKFDLTLFAALSSEGPRGLLEYSADLFDPSTMSRFLKHFENLLRAVASDPNQPLSALPLLPESERRQMLQEWNDTDAAFPSAAACVHQLVEAQASKRPEALAVAWDGGGLSYGELDRRANQLAHRLLRLGMGPEATAGVVLQRSPHLVTAYLAVLKAGGAYIAVDPAFPPQRLSQMLSTAQARVLLTQERLFEALGGFEGEVMIGQEAAEALAQEGTDGPGCAAEAKNLAYVIFTSGSTGKPKGVALTHGGLANLILWHQREYDLSPSDRATHLSGLGFDASVWELWPCLASGACLHLVAAQVAAAPAELPAWWGSRGITLSFLATPLAETLLASPLPSKLPLRALLTGGDRLHRAPDGNLPFTLVNHYGPTEGTVVTTSGAVAAGAAHHGAGPSPPIGRPIANIRVCLLDRRLRLAPAGVVGELCIAGAGLARGYLQRPGLTAQRFLPHPFQEAGARLYRTGDLARWLPHGELAFVGRFDHQVKIRGFRIELGEIEAALGSQTGVSQAVVTAPLIAGQRRLVAYVVKTGEEATVEQLQSRLQETLPAYMVPSSIVFMPELPKAPSGKIDRQALPLPEGRATAAKGFIAPRTPAEEVVAGIWADLLGIEQVGAEDDFFALGGHSLLAAAAVSRIGQAFGIELPLHRFFDASSLAALARFIERGQGVGPASAHPLKPQPRSQAMPLSQAQERLWFLDRMEPASPAYNIPALARLRGELDCAAMQHGLNQAVVRHEVLRTAFGEQGGDPFQRILPDLTIPLPLTDLGALSPAQQEMALDRLALDEAARSFDLKQPPLLRALLVRLAPAEHVLLLSVHHIVADGWTMRVLVRDLAHLYQAARSGSPASLPALPVQYADYAAWQRQWLQGPQSEAQLDYWRHKLGGRLPVLDLPADRIRRARQAHPAGRQSLTLPAGLSRQLQALSRRQGVTLFMTLLAAFKILLQRLSGQSDVIVGAPIAGRSLAETENLAGIFLNTLALRTDLSGGPSFIELLDRLRATALGAYSNQDVPFEKLLEALAPERDLSRTPVFQAFFNMLAFPVEEIRLSELRVEEISAPDLTSKFDLTVYARHRGGRLHFEWVYDAGLFSAPRMSEMTAQYRLLLAQAAAGPEEPIDRFTLLTDSFAKRLPDPRAPLRQGWEGAVHERFAKQAKRVPDRIAVVDRQSHCSYGALQLASGRLSRRLRRGGVGRQDVVAVYGHRSGQLPAAVLAALQAGAAFLILDPAYPAAALRDRLQAARPRAWLHIESAGPAPAEVDEWCCSLPPQRRLKLSHASPPSGPDQDDPDVQVEPDDRAYIAFTSGSAGRPRGVEGAHRPLSHFLSWHARRFQLNESDRFSMLSGLSHDPLLRDLFTPLWLGAALAIPDPEQWAEPGWLAGWLKREQVSVAHLTPALGQLIGEGVGAKAALDALRYAFFGGDLLTQSDAARLREQAPRASCVNFYGTTETPQAMSCFVASWQAAPTASRTPLGQGIDNVQLLVLSRGEKLSGMGEIGEILVRTPYLAKGYLGDQELTRQRFLPNPFTAEATDRVYRSGDLGRYSPDGNVEFAGRADSQVSVRGFRVELEEIEGTLVQHPLVGQSALLACADPPAGCRLLAYVTQSGAEKPDPEDLQDFLAKRLPSYMVPSWFLALDRLPLTPNGKLDRRALPVPSLDELTGERPHAAPRNPVEETLAQIWQEALGLDRVGIHDNFFNLGGHSLLATRLVARIQRATGRELSLRSLFEAPTVAGLASLLAAQEDRSGGNQALPLPAIQPRPKALHEPFPLTDIQQAYWVGRSGSLELGGVASHRYLEVDCVDLGLKRLASAWQQLVEAHPMLRAVFLPDGRQAILPEVQPYRIEEVDLQSLDPEAVQQELAAIRRRMSHQLLDISRWPLFEIRAARLSGSRHRLFLSFDYLIADAWSFQILLRDLIRLYSNPHAEQPPLQASFRDYVLATLELKESELYRRSAEYWKARLDDLPAGPELPLSRDPGTLTKQVFVRRSWTLGAQQWQRLKKRGAAEGVTASSVLLAAFAEVLGTWSKSRRFSLVLTLFNRLPFHPQVDRIVGDFTSTTLLELRQVPKEPFSARVRRCQEQLWSDLDHRYMSGVEVVREMGRARGRQAQAATPIVFTSTLDLAAVQGSNQELPELPGEVAYSISQTPQVLLDHQVAERQGALHINWDAVEEAFPEGMLQDMFEAYCGFLSRLADEEARWDERVDSLTPAAQLEAWAAYNACGAPVPEGLLQDRFLEQASRQPDRLAVISRRLSLTYGQLQRRAARLARRLRSLGARPNRLVGVVMEKGWEQAVAVLAVLQSGAAYLPLDADLPPERLRSLLEQGEARLALTQPWLEGKLDWPQQLQLLAVEESEDDSAADEPLLAPPQAPGDLAYVIFTSGSTGLPKGVMIDHRGALNSCIDINQRFAVGPDDRVLALSALSFDLSVYDLFGPLSAGGAVVLPDPSQFREPAHWVELLQRERVTLWNTVPALMEMLTGYIKGSGGSLPGALRLAMLSGDWIPVALPDQIRSLAQGIEVISLGGATEASIWSILHPVEKIEPAQASIPYGKPMANQRVYVLDESLDPRPFWVPGQLYIGGVGLAKGYWRDEEKTRSSFVAHPGSGERLYRTGDLGRLLPEGKIEFLGREDLQVKIQGYRIELGEVEAALAQHPSVGQAAVAAAGKPRGDKRLVGYVVLTPDGEASSDELRSFLGRKLPAYMVPSTITALEAMPLTPNGKVDRRALLLPEEADPVGKASYVAPRTPVEKALAGLAAQVLEISRVGLYDNFFEIGGNSVTAILLISRVRQEFQVELPLRNLFESPTVASLSAAVLERQAEQQDEEEVAQLLAELEGLSEENVKELLMEEAEGAISS